MFLLSSSLQSLILTYLTSFFPPTPPKVSVVSSSTVHVTSMTTKIKDSFPNLPLAKLGKVRARKSADGSASPKPLPSPGPCTCSTQFISLRAISIALQDEISTFSVIPVLTTMCRDPKILTSLFFCPPISYEVFWLTFSIGRCIAGAQQHIVWTWDGDQLQARCTSERRHEPVRTSARGRPRTRW